MDKETFFFTLFIIWYYKQYGYPHNLHLMLARLYHYTFEFINYYNHIVCPDFFNYKNINETDEEKTIEEQKIEEKLKPQPRYEDKYLNEIRKLDKEIIFDEEEKVLQCLKFLDYKKIITDEYFEKWSEIRDILGVIESKLTKYESPDEEYCICDDDEDEDFHLGETKEERVKKLLIEQKTIQDKENKLNQEYQSKEGIETQNKKIIELSKNFIIKARINKLKNCFVIEYTPLGNVLMIYDDERETFKYYSDNAIPYRYLEVVARKYVKQFACRHIFVDMEEELKLSEEKWEKERKEKEEKEADEKRKKEEAIKNLKPIEEKKNVFTKFKSYNKDAGTGHINTAAPPKNSIPNKKLTQEQENEKVLIKERANRYTYEGKFANFSFLKKIDRKVVDKKLALSFSDFKKMQINK